MIILNIEYKKEINNELILNIIISNLKEVKSFHYIKNFKTMKETFEYYKITYHSWNVSYIEIHNTVTRDKDVFIKDLDNIWMREE